MSVTGPLLRRSARVRSECSLGSRTDPAQHNRNSGTDKDVVVAPLLDRDHHKLGELDCAGLLDCREMEDPTSAHSHELGSATCEFMASPSFAKVSRGATTPAKPRFSGTVTLSLHLYSNPSRG